MLARGRIKRTDTVGQPPRAENHVLHMPSLKAQKSLESNAATAAVPRGNRMTNSIRTFSDTSELVVE
jgi:hypothetical protein